MMTSTKPATDSPRRRFRDPAAYAPDEGTPAELQRLLERRPGVLATFLDEIENMNGAGEIAIGVRELGSRGEVDPSTAWRRRRTITALGAWDRAPELDFKPPNRSRPTHGFRVPRKWLRAAFKLRNDYRPRWHERFRPRAVEPDPAAAERLNCIDATKSFAGRESKPSTEPLESLTVVGEAILSPDDAQLADLEDREKPETSERSSDAPLHPRDAAALPEPRFRPIEARRRLPNPHPQQMRRVVGFTPKRVLREKIGRWLTDCHGVAAWIEFEAVMARAGPEAQELFDRCDAAMRASGWVDRP